MSRLSIRQKGDPILRAVAREVETSEIPALAKLAADMSETMHDADGIGLAAPQVGQSIRMIVLSQGRTLPAMVMVNPDIVSAKDYQRSIEGCLSVPRSQWNQAVSRRERIVVNYFDLDGTRKRLKAAKQFAAVIQHEVDHLNGILFTDYVRPLASDERSINSDAPQ